MKNRLVYRTQRVLRQASHSTHLNDTPAEDVIRDSVCRNNKTPQHTLQTVRYSAFPEADRFLKTPHVQTPSRRQLQKVSTVSVRYPAQRAKNEVKCRARKPSNAQVKIPGLKVPSQLGRSQSVSNTPRE